MRFFEAALPLHMCHEGSFVGLLRGLGWEYAHRCGGARLIAASCRLPAHMSIFSVNPSAPYRPPTCRQHATLLCNFFNHVFKVQNKENMMSAYVVVGRAIPEGNTVYTLTISMEPGY